jgi:hypothetical protein
MQVGGNWNIRVELGYMYVVTVTFEKVSTEKKIISQQRVSVIGYKRYYYLCCKRKNQLDATKCWFIYSTCFENYYAHLQEYITEYRFLVSKSVSRLGCVAQSC